jgi:outer membrane protein OmpA-like peptidoglycan-associated protein
MKTFILAPLLIAASLYAVDTKTYEDNYRVTDLNETIKANDNVFMQGNFEQIIRFEMINMKEDKNARSIVDSAVKKIEGILDEGKKVKVTIIGHTDTFITPNEKTADSDVYANKIQNWFRSDFDRNDSLTLSQKYVEEIENRMLESNLPEDIFYTESRGGLDQGFSEGTQEGKDLSNRVMVTLYVYKRKDLDSDRDGVFDREDKCPNTARGTKVDSDGCPVDSDGDGVLDYQDQCPETPEGVAVDKKGCPLDSDKDGIYDYKDKCVKTLLGLKVDPNGCPLKSRLHLNFKTSSDKILKSSYPEVKRFANFMKENPMYNAKIIGHTDSHGKAAKNMDLSQRRAAAAMKALVADGVEASRLTSSGRGELDPIETNRTAAGRKANRRTEVQLILVKKQ